MTDVTACPDWMENFPVSMFTIVIGTTGLTLALAAAEQALGFGTLLSSATLGLTLLLFVVVSVSYASKAFRCPDTIVQEWQHPVKIAFFPAISISLLLLSAALLQVSKPLAHAIWLIATPAQAILTIAVISGWIGRRSFQHGHLTPAWFIPVVGNVIVPFAGMPLGYIEIGWFFLSIGLLFWIVLLSLVMNRLIFHDPLPERLQPTLVILIAPPAVGFTSWVLMNGGVDAFARVLLNVAYLFTLIVLVQMPRILRLPFALSFWALSFPFAGVTVASFVYARETGSAAHTVIGLILLGMLTVVMIGLILRTVEAVRTGTAFLPD